MTMRLLAFLLLIVTASATAAAPPRWETTDHGGGVHLFRYEDHQSLFVVTRDGVIVTDPIALNRPEVGALYLREIRRVTRAPIRYLIYSHSHYDHVAGGAPFVREGALVIAHARAGRRLANARMPQVVKPDVTVDDGVTAITLGGVRFELIGLGPAHSDTMLVFRLPHRGIIFTVDWVSVGQGPGAWFGWDMHPGDYVGALDRLLALEWTTMLTGHPTADGRLGGRRDAERMRDYFAWAGEASATLFASQPPGGPRANTGQCTPGGIAATALPTRFTDYVTEAAVRVHLERFCLYRLQGF